ncbi:hypothetical protein [Falsihalocynthiibacter arcticus]|uniref:Uncharacterized protein n=1 Tax=Falsihalocynthiibacter arcticus TaxID=1579316 RepID=A0A126V4F6_9RHOB|nr:hypothetical protein [Falsihalocynthiibacter arcticus]AML53037.1 hypothetical protein RC74_18805 [Falsihalocynthiibacter arcticus]
MSHSPERSNQQSITKAELARHLNVDATSVGRIAASIGLEAIAGRYPWRKIWRREHKTEGVWLKSHHATLIASGSTVLAEVEILEEALKTPL